MIKIIFLIFSIIIPTMSIAASEKEISADKLNPFFATKGYVSTKDKYYIRDIDKTIVAYAVVVTEESNKLQKVRGLEILIQKGGGSYLMV